jgi:eukaryotic-like serine/threonine-protein kinase
MTNGSAKSKDIPVDPLVGHAFGRYQIKELIDKGGWGNVYRATDSTLEKDVTIKIIHHHVLQDENNIKRFRREARLLCRLQSCHVIKILDADTTPAPHLVMEYFDGMPLSEWLSANGPMNAQMAIELFYQLCSALAEAETLDIIHRDLKPASILIKTTGNAVEARIVDFGLAKCITTDNTCAGKITTPGEMLGSPRYMSPEAFDGICDHRSDIYSLGCIMYELLAGRPAFKAKYAPEYLLLHQSNIPERISKVNPGAVLPPKLEEVIFACLEKSPDKRYQSARLCAKDLDAIKC